MHARIGWTEDAGTTRRPVLHLAGYGAKDTRILDAGVSVHLTYGDNDGKVGILIVLANSTTNNEQTNLPCACINTCVYRVYRDTFVRERADRCPCVDDGMHVMSFTYARVCVCGYVRLFVFYVCMCVCESVCAEIFAIIYYMCTCQSIGTEEELKRKEMKL